MNQGTLPLMVFYEDCNRVIQQVSHLLTDAGFMVVESFDLQDARANHSSCSCPHHGTSQCTCQLAVLLVYGTDGNPVTLTIHGNDERTELSLVEAPAQVVDPVMKKNITCAIEPGYFVYTDHESMSIVP